MSHANPSPDYAARLNQQVERLCKPAERKPIPSDGAPERSLERRPRAQLEPIAAGIGVEEAPWLSRAAISKDALVRAMGHAYRDASMLRILFEQVGTPASLSFLAELVLQGRMRFVDLPAAVRDDYVIGPRTRTDWTLRHRLLRTVSVVFIGWWEGAPALYVPDGARRPYAQALLALRSQVSDAATVRNLEKLVRSMPSPSAPWAPGLPTQRAKRRLETPGPDRILELEVQLSEAGIMGEATLLPVRRRILVSYRRSLGALHEAIRIAFAWPQRARHWFYSPARHQAWGPPRRKLERDEVLDEWKTPIRDLLAKRGAQARYVIDPPTHWVHDIETRAIHAPGLVPGAPSMRDGPLVIEACGAPPPPELSVKSDYREFLERWRKGEDVRWRAGITSPDFDPDAAIHLDAINYRLAQMG